MSGKFLSKEDVETPILVTITEVRQDDVSMENEPSKMKWTMGFKENDKRLVLNNTNISLLGGFLGDDTDQWHNRQIVLFNDPTVMFGGKAVGGIRVRLPKQQAAPAPQPTQPDPALDDDIPF